MKSNLLYKQNRFNFCKSEDPKSNGHDNKNFNSQESLQSDDESDEKIQDDTLYEFLDSSLNIQMDSLLEKIKCIKFKLKC